MARRCLVEGCGQLVKAGKVVCKGHARTVFGRVVGEEVAALARELAGMAEAETRGQREVVREFRRRVERGEYAALFAGRLREAVEGASAGTEFEEERAALRAALWRVMEDEDVDAVKLAHAVSRVVGTTVRAVQAEERVRKAGGVEGDHDRLAALLEMLGADESTKSGVDGRS